MRADAASVDILGTDDRAEHMAAAPAPAAYATQSAGAIPADLTFERRRGRVPMKDRRARRDRAGRLRSELESRCFSGSGLMKSADGNLTDRIDYGVARRRCKLSATAAAADSATSEPGWSATHLRSPLGRRAPGPQSPMQWKRSVDKRSVCLPGRTLQPRAPAVAQVAEKRPAPRLGPYGPIRWNTGVVPSRCVPSRGRSRAGALKPAPVHLFAQPRGRQGQAPVAPSHEVDLAAQTGQIEQQCGDCRIAEVKQRQRRHDADPNSRADHSHDGGELLHLHHRLHGGCSAASRY